MIQKGPLAHRSRRDRQQSHSVWYETNGHHTYGTRNFGLQAELAPFSALYISCMLRIPHPCCFQLDTGDRLLEPGQLIDVATIVEPTLQKARQPGATEAQDGQIYLPSTVDIAVLIVRVCNLWRMVIECIQHNGNQVFPRVHTHCCTQWLGWPDETSMTWISTTGCGRISQRP